MKFQCGLRRFGKTTRTAYEIERPDPFVLYYPADLFIACRITFVGTAAFPGAGAFAGAAAFTADTAASVLERNSRIQEKR